jgi:hypothetical protein
VLFGWLVADGWCWSLLREEYCWLVAGGWFVVREKYCWLVADKPSEQGYRALLFLSQHHPTAGQKFRFFIIVKNEIRIITILKMSFVKSPSKSLSTCFSSHRGSNPGAHTFS